MPLRANHLHARTRKCDHARFLVHCMKRSRDTAGNKLAPTHVPNNGYTVRIGALVDEFLVASPVHFVAE